MTQLMLLRHGESEGNVDTSVYLRKRNHDIELTDKGKKQAEEVAAWIKDTLKAYSFPYAYVISSPYIRALQTTIIVRDGLEGMTLESVDPLLIEQQYGQADGCDGLSQFAKSDPIQLKLYNLYGDFYYKPPQGESLYDVYIRCGLFLERHQWFKNGGFVLISSHKSVSRMMHYFLCGDIPENWENGKAQLYTLNGRTATIKVPVLPKS